MFGSRQKSSFGAQTTTSRSNSYSPPKASFNSTWPFFDPFESEAQHKSASSPLPSPIITPSSFFDSQSVDTPDSPISVFGSLSVETPASTSLFGSESVETPAFTSLFGSQPSASAFRFGSQSVETPTSTSRFGSQSVETPAFTSLFGSQPSAPAFRFGSQSVETPTSTSRFGSQSVETPAFTSLFGSQLPASAFGFGSRSVETSSQPIKSGKGAVQQDQLNQDTLDTYQHAVNYARQVAYSEEDRAKELKTRAHELEDCAGGLLRLAEWLDCQIKVLSEGLNIQLHVKAQREHEERQQRDKAAKAETERANQAAQQAKTDRFLSSLASIVLDCLNQDNRRREEEMEREAEAKRKALKEDILQKEEAKRKVQEATLLEEHKRRENRILAEAEKRRIEQQERDRSEKERIQRTCESLRKDKDQLAKAKDQLAKTKEQLAKDKDQLAKDNDQLAKELEALRKQTGCRNEEPDRAFKDKEQQERRRRALARQEFARSSATLSEPQRHSNAWRTYLSEWEFLTKGEYPGLVSEVTFVHFPWPQLHAPTTPEGLSRASIKNFLFSEHHSKGKPDRVRVMEALRRWHPDKSKVLADKIDPKEGNRIRDGIEVVVRHLNNIKDEMNL